MPDECSLGGTILAWSRKVRPHHGLHAWPHRAWPHHKLSQSFVEYLKNLASDISIVQGDFDEFPSPEHTVSHHALMQGGRVF